MLGDSIIIFKVHFSKFITISVIYKNFGNCYSNNF